MSSKPSSLLYYAAVIEVPFALVTMVFGALTTTKNAGMAFADWPTSDGYFMVTYPWLRDFAQNWDKFLEHGHRLFALGTGFWTILLVLLAFWLEDRKWVKWLAVGVLLGVISQGLLGGFRVRLNERGLAMLHGIFAALFFSVVGMMVAVTNPRWRRISDELSDGSPRNMNSLKRWGIACILLVLTQYVYGSLIRHQGTGLHEHLGLGFLVLIAVIGNTVVSYRQPILWLRRSSLVLVLLTFTQVLFGLKTWVLKFGFPHMGYVAVADSIQAVSLRTLHMVWGACLLMAAVVHVLKVYRIAKVTNVTKAVDTVSTAPSPAATVRPLGGHS